MYESMIQRKSQGKIQAIKIQNFVEKQETSNVIAVKEIKNDRLKEEVKEGETQK